MSKKDNLLVHKYPEVAAQFHQTKNGDLKLEELTCGSNKEVWWICEKGHIYKQTVNNKTKQNQGCPYCSGRYATPENNITVTHPHLLEEWDWEKNKIDPKTVKHQSNKKAWWVCKNNKNHKWESAVYSRTGKNPRNCPYCGNKKVCLDNCLATTHPHLIKEWDYEKNKVTPYDITAGYNKRVWWACEKNKNHTWCVKPNQRAFQFTGCPDCFKGNQTSFPEQAIFFYIRKLFPDSINRYKHPAFKNNTELDIFIPSLNMGIEYDGYYHKQNRIVKMDENKNKICKELDVKLIRIRQKGLPSIQCSESIMIEHDISKFSYLQECIIQLCKIVRFHSSVEIACDDINLEKDRAKINRMIERNEIENSICNTHPQLLKEWNYKKNIGIRPESLSHGTNTTVWWICDKNHEWEASISNRCGVNKTGCPYCDGKKTSIESCLAVLNPDLSAEWHPIKNGELTPYNVRIHSNRKVWWMCMCGHEWEYTINNRTHGKGKCKKCS